MEQVKYLSGPRGKDGWTEHWSLQCDKSERTANEAWMGTQVEGSKRKPHYAVEEISNGVKVRCWIEYPT